MTGPTTLELMCRLANPAERSVAAAELATRLGVHSLLIYLRDPELDVLLPAPGFPQTVRGHPRLAGFLARCTTPGLHRSADGVGDPPLNAWVCGGGVTLVLFGGEPVVDALEEVAEAVPLLMAVLHAERGALLASSAAEVARAAGKRSHELALALDQTRAELQRALTESARLNGELGVADRRKDEFLAMLGHELRNPMAAITAALELLKKGDNPRAREIIARHSTQLAHLVDDLLDVARISGGRITLKLEPVDVAEVVARCVEATEALMTRKTHTLTVEVAGPLHAQADATRLEQMITNLLVNAAKYTNPGGEIVLRAGRERDRAVIRVKDNGVGIPPQMLPHIFELFLQVAPGIERAAGGLGIGLSLVSKLVSLHGGTVEALSEVGKGSEFVLEVPLAATAPARRPLPVVRGPVSPKRVLVVDDNVDVAQSLAEIVSNWGHATRQVNDGLAALEAAADFHPHIVLLDIGLPGLDGYEVVRRLRQMPEVAQARIVSVSGFGLETDRQKSVAAGFDAHFVKPVDLEALRNTLEC